MPARDSSLPSALNGGGKHKPDPNEDSPPQHRRAEKAKRQRTRRDERKEERDDDSPKADFWDEYNALGELFDGDISRNSLATRSEVTEEQIVVFSQARRLSTYFGLTILDDVVDDMLRFAISKGRKSRTEFVRSFQMAMQGEQAQVSGLDKMLGGFR